MLVKANSVLKQGETLTIKPKLCINCGVGCKICPQESVKDSFYKTRKQKSTKNQFRAFLFLMAEREGFEPSVEVSPHTRLAGELKIF